MKKGRHRRQSDLLWTSGGVPPPAGGKNFAVAIEPSDEDINRIASMPIEQIKRELALMGAPDIPVPARSDLFKNIKFSPRHETEPKQCERAIWQVRGLKERSGAWTRNRSSVTLKVRVCGFAMASLLLIAATGSVLLLRSAHTVTIPAPGTPDLLDLAVSLPEKSNDQSNYYSQPERPRTISSVPSRQSSPPGRRQTGTQLAKKHEVREAESIQPQPLAASMFTGVAPELTPKGTQQDDVFVSQTKNRQPCSERVLEAVSPTQVRPICRH